MNDLSLGGEDVRLPEDMINNNDFDLSHPSLGARKLGHFTHMAVFNPKGLSRFGQEESSFGRRRRSKRKLHRGPKGGQYYIKKGRKVYV